jgi:serine/threonine-protein kinase
VVPTAPAPPPATPAPPIQGWLLVLPKPWAEVTVDGRALGPTPIDRIPLAPGSHAVILTHPQYQPFTRKVEIRPGEVFRLRWDFAQDGVKRR